MVKGIDIFQEYFNEYTDQYVLIGGAACSVSFEEQDINFGRTTKDLDIVLIVEAQTKEFGERFWKFIKDGKYRIRAKSNGEPQFYRFDKPEDERFPKMIELFSRTNYLLQEENGLTPIHIDDSVSSLSAILRNDIIRIVSDMVLQKCILPDEVRKDMEKFIEQFDVTESELKNLKIRGTKPEDIKRVLQTTYLD